MVRKFVCYCQITSLHFNQTCCGNSYSNIIIFHSVNPFSTRKIEQNLSFKHFYLENYKRKVYQPTYH